MDNDANTDFRRNTNTGTQISHIEQVNVENLSVAKEMMLEDQKTDTQYQWVNNP